jgi:AcrR family transcriptional regulator
MKDKTNDIVEKATRVYKERGLHSVSMDDMASFCGISKKTLYVNFKSKEELVKTVVQKMITKTGKYIRLCPDISPNAVNEIVNFSEHILSRLEILTPVFIRDLKKYYPEVYMQLIVFRDNSIIPYVQRCLKRGIEEDIFRPGMDKKNAGSLYCWQIQNVLEGDASHTDVNQIIKNTNDLFIHGILNSKGLKMLSMNKLNEKTHAKRVGENKMI